MMIKDMLSRVNILIFGTGNLYQKYKNRFKFHNILALIDNSLEKQGKYIDGKKIISPSDIQQYEFNYIVILVQQYENIYQQLLKIGIPLEKIITIDPEGLFGNFREIKGDIYNDTADILLVSHEMNLRGAPLMLYETAKILRENGFEISIATTKEGELQQYYFDLGVSVYEFDDFKFSSKEVKDIFGKYKVVFVNTLALSDLIYQLESHISNIIWWLHEEWSAYDILKPNRKLQFDNNVKVFGVGKRAIEAFGDYYGHDILIRNLLWGIKDEYSMSYNYNEKLIFAVIGEVCKIKGQDILIDVVECNYQNIIDSVEFWIIGQVDQEIKKTFQKYNCFKVLGQMKHQEVMDLYKKVDVVLSTSRNDTMPVVLIEGLMNKKLVMTSTGTGVSNYIINHYNGIVYESEDVLNISREIFWIINNTSKLNEIKKQGYRLYKQEFSINSFQEKLLEIIRWFV